METAGLHYRHTDPCANAILAYQLSNAAIFIYGSNPADKPTMCQHCTPGALLFWIRSAITIHTTIHSCCICIFVWWFLCINWFVHLQALKLIWNFMQFKGTCFFFFIFLHGNKVVFSRHGVDGVNAFDDERSVTSNFKKNTNSYLYFCMGRTSDHRMLCVFCICFRFFFHTILLLWYDLFQINFRISHC